MSDYIPITWQGISKTADFTSLSSPGNGEVQGINFQIKLNDAEIDRMFNVINLLGGDIPAKTFVRATRLAIKPILRAARALAPVRTGALKKSLGIRVKRYTRDGIVYGVMGPRRSKVFTGKNGKAIKPSKYAHLAERGHATRKPLSGGELRQLYNYYSNRTITRVITRGRNKGETRQWKDITGLKSFRDNFRQAYELMGKSDIARVADMASKHFEDEGGQRKFSKRVISAWHRQAQNRLRRAYRKHISAGTRVGAKPFIRPALESNRSAAVKIFLGEVERDIQGALNLQKAAPGVEGTTE